ncbi:U-box domain-containing protein 44-like isoform X2 [Phoenix dactylifera]|uniref:RING-type E3 ubiquitin transferase n=1 Tax=Phoenix dactylifera TaxID=42345 RepID=A0A8B7CC94_PHODC|nr:U-box domain-containing protein 44-like isoform X2 [Phoenix dactylifera]XP_008796068.2 U-box domain-containing protein 44-like isoform X2 [Phoenix dactylifera]
MTLIELIPIGTILAVLTDQVLATAAAARDVLIEKESFKALSKYLYDIEPVLKQLQLRELNDTQAARQALEFLKDDVKKAKDIVDKYKNRARFYLLVRCRSIVGEIQDVTRDIGRSLAALSLASTEVLSDISERVNRLHGEMQKAEFEASQAQLRIVEKLDQGLHERKRDQSFANNMLEEIARTVGVPVEPSEINEELSSLKREKEEAAAHKERAEEIFLEQVIELLSRADAAIDQEEIEQQYRLRVQSVENYATQDVHIPPLKSFMCPITGKVMVDPVSLCTGTACERTAIEDWLESGRTTDPDTGQVLEDFTLRSNIGLRQSIEEWRELNYCLKIRSAKGKLQSGNDSLFVDAFDLLQEVIHENPMNKDWIAIEGLIDIIVPMVGSSHNKDLKRQALVTLTAIIEGHSRNKNRVVEAGGVDRIVVCLVRGSGISKAAIKLLFELLQDGSTWKESTCTKLKQQSSAIFFLVTLLHGTDRESEEKAEVILSKLCDDDDDAISAAAACGWYKPLIDHLCHGPERSRMAMARFLVETEFIDQNIKLLGEGGAIPPLVKMASGNLESKDLALSALAKLLSCRDNKRIVASAGGVPLVIEHIFSSHAPTIIVAKCSEILERLSSDDGIEFLVDANGTRLELGPIITNLMAILQKSNSSPTIRKPVLRSLLNICKSEEILAEKTVAATNGVSLVLPLLEDPDQDIRELALKLIHHFSQNEPDGIADFLLDSRLETFVGFLEGDTCSDAQVAAAGLIACLPKSEVALTNSLIKLDVIPILLNMLRIGTAEAKETVLGALFRFTDPSNIEMQQLVVNLGAYPLLVSILQSGSTTAKARAAALIGNLSSNSSRLTAAPVRTGCWCFRASPPSVCELHGGICDMTSTFCLLKAKALPCLVNLLQEHQDATTYETLQALGTLVQDGLSYRGAKILHQAGAIDLILGVLNWGSVALKEAALVILEKVFQAREVSDYYCTAAKIPLIGLSTQRSENGELGRRAARVLAEIERYSKSSSMPLT